MSRYNECIGWLPSAAHRLVGKILAGVLVFSIRIWKRPWHAAVR